MPPVIAPPPRANRFNHYVSFTPATTLRVALPNAPPRLRHKDGRGPHKKQRLNRAIHVLSNLDHPRLLPIQHASAREGRHYGPVIVDALIHRPPHLLRVLPRVRPSRPSDRLDGGGKGVVPPQQPGLVPAHVFPHDVPSLVVAEAELDVAGYGVHFGGGDDGGVLGGAVAEYDLGFVGYVAQAGVFAVVDCGFRGGG